MDMDFLETSRGMGGSEVTSTVEVELDRAGKGDTTGGSRAGKLSERR